MIKRGDVKGCIAGKILRIDLSNKKIWTEETKSYAKKTLGGRGINSLIMINEIEPKVSSLFRRGVFSWHNDSRCLQSRYLNNKCI